MANDTLLFKDVIGNYDEFIHSTIAIETLDHIEVCTINKDGNVKVPLDEWCKEVYRILLRHFRNYEIAFDNRDDFLDLFWETIEVHTPNFYQRKGLYTRLLQMDDNELLDNGLQLSNLIEHNDDIVADVFAPLKNITSQTQIKNISAYSTKLRSHINTLQYNLINDFCKKFNYLFILYNVSSNYYG